MTQRVRSTTKIAKALSQAPGLWAPYDKDTHKTFIGTPKQGTVEIDADYNHFRTDVWEDDEGAQHYYVTQIHSNSRMRTWDQSVLLAICCLSVKADFVVDSDFGNVYGHEGRLPKPTFVKVGMLDDVPNAPRVQGWLEADTKGKIQGSVNSGCSPKMNVQCVIHDVVLSDIAKMLSAGKETMAHYTEGKMAEIKASLSRLSGTDITIWEITDPKLIDSMKNDTFGLHVHKLARAKKCSEEQIMRELLDVWEGSATKVFSVPLVRNGKTTKVTTKGLEDRVYDIVLNPMLALSLAYGRSYGPEHGPKHNVLAKVNGGCSTRVKDSEGGVTVVNPVIPTVFRQFAQTFEHDLRVRNQLGGKKDERIQGVYSAYETMGCLPHCRQMEMHELIDFIYGPNFEHEIGMNNDDPHIRRGAKNKLRNTRRKLREDIRQLVADGIISEAQQDKVFGQIMRGGES